jgi:hypothetical protein
MDASCVSKAGIESDYRHKLVGVAQLIPGAVQWQ